MFREDEGVQTAIVVFESEHMHNVLKAEFMAVWVPAYLEAFNKSTVCTAFKEMGVVPFNPNFITEAQIKPSLATSMRVEFSMPQPSPVHAIMNAMHVQPPTHFDLSPSNVASTSRLPQTPSR
jgi:hypothetical protein